MTTEILSLSSLTPLHPLRPWRSGTFLKNRKFHSLFQVPSNLLAQFQPALPLWMPAIMELQLALAGVNAPRLRKLDVPVLSAPVEQRELERERM
jgi:hypothetical protein